MLTLVSHWHFDHSRLRQLISGLCSLLIGAAGGNVSNLPASVDLIVGPGFKNEFLPGYPANEKSPFWESDYKDRNVIEAPFSTKIGKYDVSRHSR